VYLPVNAHALSSQFNGPRLGVSVVGKLSRFYAARFASTWTLLAGGGVSVLKALQAAAGSLSNLAMRQDAQGPLLAGREGAPLA